MGLYDCPLFHATLHPFGENSQVTGSVIVYGDGSTVAYAGKGMHLEANLGASNCTATNGT